MQLPEKVVEGLVAGLFGLAGTLATAAFSWLRDRGVAGQRQHQLDEALKRLHFWEQWMKVAVQLPQGIDELSIAKVQHEMSVLAIVLERSSHSMEAQIAVQRTETSALQERRCALPAWRRWLLYKPGRALAWLPRLFFYFGLGLSGFILFAFVEPTGRESTFFVELFFLGGTTVFWFLSRALEEPKLGHGLPIPPPPLPCPPK